MSEITSRSTAASGLLDRREFFVGSILTGFALAVQPIQAQTRIVTDDKGLTAGEVKITVAGGTIPAYRAMPDKKGGKFPVVLVVHEIFGVHEWIQDVCRRLAKLGYLAIAPALYARQGDVTNMKDINDIIRNVVAKVPDDQVMSDLDAASEWAKDNGGNIKKMAITGFCWGGRIVWLYARHNTNLRAGAAWYGRLADAPDAPKNALQPTMPVEFGKDLKVPVLGLYGGLDQGITLDTVQRMQDEVKKGKSKSELMVFPNANHGFLADYRPSYNPQAATEGWQKMLDWFKKSGMN
jgi:carboxymethylenebutenolidase